MSDINRLPSMSEKSLNGESESNKIAIRREEKADPFQPINEWLDVFSPGMTVQKIGFRVWDRVIAPGGKAIILNAVHEVLYPGKNTNRWRNDDDDERGYRINTRYRDYGGRRYDEYEERASSRRPDVDKLTVPDIDTALDVIDWMRHEIFTSSTRTLSVMRFFDRHEMPVRESDRFWGWDERDVDSFDYQQSRNGSVYLRLPRPRRFDR